MVRGGLTTRSWIIFIASECILAAILVAMSAFSAWVLFGVGFVLFGLLWTWDNHRQRLIRPAGTAIAWAAKRLYAIDPAAIPAVDFQNRGDVVPDRFLDLIEKDDREIDQRICLHAIPKPIQVKRHLDAPDPYIDIIIRLRNNSVFDLNYQSTEGRFEYKAHPLQNEPVSLNSGTVLTRYQAAAVKLRQYVTPQVAQQLQDWTGCDFNISNVHLLFTYANRKDIEKTAKFKLKGRCHIVDLA